MEPLLKYIIYFLLGLICHYLLFKGDLIEGLEFDNYDEVISNTSCQIKDCKNGWTKTDLNTSYTSNDVQELRKVAGSPMGDGEENIQLYYNNNNNTCSTYEKYDKLCFKTDKVKSETQCKEKCDVFRKCSSFSFDSYDDTNASTCCIYKIDPQADDSPIVEAPIPTPTQIEDAREHSCYKKKECSNIINDVDFITSSCICNQSTVKASGCRSGDTCINQVSVTNPVIGCKTNNSVYLLNQLRDNNRICAKNRDDNVEEDPNDIGVCACNADISQDLTECIPTASIDCRVQTAEEQAEAYAMGKNLICKSGQFCNETEYTLPGNEGKKSRCHTIVVNNPNNPNHLKPCELNVIEGKPDSKRDSEIIEEDCYCTNKTDKTLNVIEECISDSNKKYCNIKKGCSILNDCQSSYNLLDESCKYEKDGEVHMCNYLNKLGYINMMYHDSFPEKCKEITNCEIGIIPENEHCFCQKSDESVHLCKPGSNCTIEGCITRLECNSNYEYDEETKSCRPPTCNIYSDKNASSIKAECICETDKRDEHYICQRGNYCLDPNITPNIPYSGCTTHITENCPYYSDTNSDPISEDCVCDTDKREQPFVCSQGNFCLKPEGCTQKYCPEDTIINPKNHNKCINPKQEEENILNIIINKLKELINKLKAL